MTRANWTYPSGNGDWNTASNWSTNEVPHGGAIFGPSALAHASITFSQTGAEIDTIELEPGAPPCTFHFHDPGGTPPEPRLRIIGKVSNRSGRTQTFHVASSAVNQRNAELVFKGTANAGGPNVFYEADPVDEQGYGGGIIRFIESSNAGSARFRVTTGATAPPSGVKGAEVNFGDTASAGTAHFEVFGTTGSDGETFGNVIFFGNSTAASGTFVNNGGTLDGGDGGNTQFFNQATAGNGHFHNLGGTVAGANGGDCAFDGDANGGNGTFHNHPAPVQGAYGGVASFNNNTPGSASAGSGHFFNYGANEEQVGGGGHVELTSKWGSATAAQATFHNFAAHDVAGVALDGSAAGHTVFSIFTPNPDGYFPTAADATFWNHGARNKRGRPGYTEFTFYARSSDSGEVVAGPNVPTAGNATFYNGGGDGEDAAGGFTSFAKACTAANATLIAYAGKNGGFGGEIRLDDGSSGGSATVSLHGNGRLVISGHQGKVTIGTLDMTRGGIVEANVGRTLTPLEVTGALLSTTSVPVQFVFTADDGFERGRPYRILKAAGASNVVFAGRAAEKDEKRLGSTVPVFGVDAEGWICVTFPA